MEKQDVRGQKPAARRSKGAYIWAEAPPETGARPLLSRDKIVAMAIGLADAHGVEALSMRRLATELDAGTMSLYRHVSSKDDLILLMNDAVLGEADLPPLPERPSGDWRADLRQVMLLQRTVARRHAWWVRTSVGRPQIGPNALRLNEFALGTLDHAGLGITQMQALVTMIQSYVLGVATYQIAEQEAERVSGATGEEWQQSLVPWAQRLVAEGRHPYTVRYMAEAEDWDDDRVFDYGAERVLDGIAAVIPPG